MQYPPSNPQEMIKTSQQLDNSGSDLFIASVLLAIGIFFIYTVIVPKLSKKEK
jgi:hypothetical protein